MDVREKLVEILKQAPFEGKVLDEWWFEEKIKRIADHLIAHSVTVQEWIPVDDDLPKKITNKVIVLCKNGYIGYGHYENYMGNQPWYNLESGKPFNDWDLEDCESYEVTHWQPMPEPPDGE